MESGKRSIILFETLLNSGGVEAQFEKIIDDCKRKKTKYKDPEFYPQKNIIEEDKEILKEHVWRRIEDQYPNDLFTNISPDSIQQGRLGNCYFVSALIYTAQHPNLVKSLFHPKSSLEYGCVLIYFYFLGERVPVIIDTQVAYQNDSSSIPLFCSPRTESDSCWFVLIEKAYAKACGGYYSIQGGSTQCAARLLFDYFASAYNKMTDLIPKFYQNDKNFDVNENFFEVIQKMKMNKAMIGTSISDDNTEKNTELLGLISKHSYYIIDIRKSNDMRFIKLRNPWGIGQYKGYYSKGSDKWTEQLKKDLDYDDAEDGSFWMLLENYFYYFNSICFSLPKIFNWKEMSVYGKIEGYLDGRSPCVDSPNVGCIPQWTIKFTQKTIVRLSYDAAGPVSYFGIYIVKNHGNKVDCISKETEIERSTTNTSVNGIEYIVDDFSEPYTFFFNRDDKMDEPCYFRILIQSPDKNFSVKKFNDDFIKEKWNCKSDTNYFSNPEMDQWDPIGSLPLTTCKQWFINFPKLKKNEETNLRFRIFKNISEGPLFLYVARTDQRLSYIYKKILGYHFAIYPKSEYEEFSIPISNKNYHDNNNKEFKYVFTIYRKHQTDVNKFKFSVLSQSEFEFGLMKQPDPDKNCCYSISGQLSNNINDGASPYSNSESSLSLECLKQWCLKFDKSPTTLFVEFIGTDISSNHFVYLEIKEKEGQKIGFFHVNTVHYDFDIDKGCTHNQAIWEIKDVSKPYSLCVTRDKADSLSNYSLNIFGTEKFDMFEIDKFGNLGKKANKFINKKNYYYYSKEKQQIDFPEVDFVEQPTGFAPKKLRKLIDSKMNENRKINNQIVYNSILQKKHISKRKSSSSQNDLDELSYSNEDKENNQQKESLIKKLTENKIVKDNDKNSKSKRNKLLKNDMNSTISESRIKSSDDEKEIESSKKDNDLTINIDINTDSNSTTKEKEKKKQNKKLKKGSKSRKNKKRSKSHSKKSKETDSNSKTDGSDQSTKDDTYTDEIDQKTESKHQDKPDDASIQSTKKVTDEKDQKTESKSTNERKDHKKHKDDSDQSNDESTKEKDQKAESKLKHDEEHNEDSDQPIKENAKKDTKEELNQPKTEEEMNLNLNDKENINKSTKNKRFAHQKVVKYLHQLNMPYTCIIKIYTTSGNESNNDYFFVLSDLDLVIIQKQANRVSKNFRESLINLSSLSLAIDDTILFRFKSNSYSNFHEIEFTTKNPTNLINSFYDHIQRLLTSIELHRINFVNLYRPKSLFKITSQSISSRLDLLLKMNKIEVQDNFIQKVSSSLYSQSNSFVFHKMKGRKIIFPILFNSILLSNNINSIEIKKAKHIYPLIIDKIEYFDKILHIKVEGPSSKDLFNLIEKSKNIKSISFIDFPIDDFYYLSLLMKKNKIHSIGFDSSVSEKTLSKFISNNSFNNLKYFRVSNIKNIDFVSCVDRFEYLSVLSLKFCNLSIGIVFETMMSYNFLFLKEIDLSGNIGNGFSQKKITFSEKLNKLFVNEVQWEVDSLIVFMNLCADSNLSCLSMNQISFLNSNSNSKKKVNRFRRKQKVQNDFDDFIESCWESFFSNLPQKLNSVSSLNWDSNKIDDQFVAFLSKSNLLDVLFSNCDINDLSYIKKLLINSKIQSTIIKKIKFDDLNRYENLFKDFLSHLPQMKSLKKIDLGKNKFNTDCFNILSESLINSEIEFIAIDDSNQDSFTDFVNFLRKLNKSKINPIKISYPVHDIQRLELNQNEIDNLNQYLYQLSKPISDRKKFSFFSFPEFHFLKLKKKFPEFLPTELLLEREKYTKKPNQNNFLLNPEIFQINGSSEETDQYSETSNEHHKIDDNKKNKEEEEKVEPIIEEEEKLEIIIEEEEEEKVEPMIEEEEKVEIIIEEEEEKVEPIIVEEKTNEEEEIKETKIEEPTKGNNYSYYSYSSYSYYDNNQYYSYSEYSNSDNDLTLTMSMNRKKKIIYVDRKTIISKVDKNKRKKMDSMRKKERQPKV